MIRRAWALAALLLALACAPALAAPVTVNLRVEGKDTTIFEGRVRTDGHAIEQDAAGPKPCDGTNGGAHPTPGPTMTSALDDGLAWDGTWTESLQDFQIDRVGPDRGDAAHNMFWGYALNFQASDVGGCQQQVKSGDQVLYVFDFFSKKEILKLSGPKRATSGRVFRVTVVDGRDGTPVRNARVGGSKTNRFGKAILRAPRKGTLVLKAEHTGSVRSNALRVRAVRP
jgi:hypothetical protein